MHRVRRGRQALPSGPSPESRPALRRRSRASRRRSTAWAARAGRRRAARSRRACATWRASCCPCTRPASWHPGFAFGPRDAYFEEFEGAFEFEETPDQSAAIEDVLADMQRPRADGSAGVRRRGLREDRGRDPGGLPGRDGRQAGRHPDADDDPLRAALRDLREALRRLSDRGRDALPVPHPGRVAPGARRTREREDRRRRRHPSDPRQERAVPGPRPARDRRGAPLRGRPQGTHQEAQEHRRRADAHGDADPAHAPDGVHRHARSLGDRDAAGRSARDPHPDRAAERLADPRSDPARGAPRRAGLLRPQPRAPRSEAWPRSSRRSCPK